MADPIEPTAVEPATPAADAPATPDVPEGPKSALEALDAGIETADGVPLVADDPAPADVPADPAAPPVVEKEDLDMDEEEFRKTLGSAYKGRGQARVLKLWNTAKQANTFKAEAEQFKARAEEADQWEELVKGTGVTPEAFAEQIALIGHMHSDDPKHLALAYETLDKQLRTIGQKIGKGPAAALDADLLAEVEAGALPRTRAEELHQLRRNGELHQQRDARSQEQFRREQAVEQGKQSLNMLENTLKAADPQYAAKMKFLQPALIEIAQNTPPHEWSVRFQRAYKALPPLPAAPAPVVANARPAPGHMPIRGTGTGAAMRPEPKSMQEALEQGMASVGR